MGFQEEAVRSQGATQKPRNDRVVLGRRNTSGQDDNVGLESDFAPATSVDDADLQCPGVRNDGVLFVVVANEQDARFARLLIAELTEAVGADVFVKDNHFGFWLLSLQLQRVLDGGRTADAAAIRMLVIAAVHTLDHHHGRSISGESRRTRHRRRPSHTRGKRRRDGRKPRSLGDG